MKHVVWSRDGCIFCDKAKELFDSVNFEYVVKDVYENKEEFRREFPDAKTVPQIVFNGRKIGGYDELQRSFENENIYIGGQSF